MEAIGLFAQIAMVILVGAIGLVFGYSVGHKDGSQEGFNRGKAIGRHAASREVTK